MMRESTLQYIQSNFRKNLQELGKNLNDYIEIANDIPDSFGGPSIYFHQRAIFEGRDHFLQDTHLEMIYAVLPSWGMHRMGNKGAKVCSFYEFRTSILEERKILEELKKKVGVEDIDDNDIKTIVSLISKIKASMSDTSLVSSLKTLHHILPSIVPPMDRTYSIRFMKQAHDAFDKQLMQINGEDDERALATMFIEEMKFFVEKYRKTLSSIKLVKSLQEKGSGLFNTSVPKIFDNLIIAYVKHNRGDWDSK